MTTITNIILSQYENAKEAGYIQFLTMGWSKIESIMREEAKSMSDDELEATKTLYDNASENVQHHCYESEYPEIELASMLMSHWRSAVADELHGRKPAPNPSEMFPWLA